MYCQAVVVYRVGLALLALIFSCYVVPATAKGESFTGEWIEKSGSVLSLVQDGDVVQGTFTITEATSRSCIGKSVPVAGIVNQDALSLTVNMNACDSPVVMAVTAILIKDPAGTQILKAQSLIQYRGHLRWNSQILLTGFFYKTGEDIE